MSEPAQKCENNPISNQNYAQKLFIAFKTAYSCCFGLRGNLDFPDFLQKKFYSIDCWLSRPFGKSHTMEMELNNENADNLAERWNI